jgi:hypothetical protein
MSRETDQRTRNEEKDRTQEDVRSRVAVVRRRACGDDFRWHHPDTLLVRSIQLMVTSPAIPREQHSCHQ